MVFNFYYNNWFIIFIDNIFKDVSIKDFIEIFEEDGRVMDVFISRKVRKYISLGFGFVRFRKEEEGIRVIRRINRMLLLGKFVCF